MSPRDLDKPRKGEEKGLFEKYHIRMWHSDSDSYRTQKVICHRKTVLNFLAPGMDLKNNFMESKVKAARVAGLKAGCLPDRVLFGLWELSCNRCQ